MTAIPLWMAIVLALLWQLGLIRFARRNFKHAKNPPGVFWLLLVGQSWLGLGVVLVLAGYVAIGFGLAAFGIAVKFLLRTGRASRLSLAIHGHRTTMVLSPASTEALIQLYAAAMGTDLATFRAASARPELSIGDLSGSDLPFLQWFLLLQQLRRLNLKFPLTAEQAERLVGDARAASPVAADLIEPERARALLTGGYRTKLPIEAIQGQPITPEEQEALQQFRDQVTALTPSIIGLTAWAYRANDPIGFRSRVQLRSDVRMYQRNAWLFPRSQTKPNLDPAG